MWGQVLVHTSSTKAFCALFTDAVCQATWISLENFLCGLCWTELSPPLCIPHDLGVCTRISMQCVKVSVPAAPTLVPHPPTIPFPLLSQTMKVGGRVASLSPPHSFFSRSISLNWVTLGAQTGVLLKCIVSALIHLVVCLTAPNCTPSLFHNFVT